MSGSNLPWTSRLSTGRILLLFLAVGLVFPYVAGTNYMLQVGSLALTYIVLGQSLNAVYGYTGYLSLAQTAFWGAGGYVVALLTVKAGMGAWPALLISGPATAVLGLGVGYISLRLTRYAFTIVTLVVLLGTALITTYWTSLTNGSLGVIGIPPPNLHLFGRVVEIDSPVSFYYVTLALSTILLALMYCGLSSRWGDVLRAIKLDEELSSSFGIRVFRHKLAVFALAAFCSGTIGAVHAFRISIVDPTIFALPAAVVIIAVVMLGGPGSFLGVIVSGVALTFLPELLRASDGGRFFFFGLVLVVGSVAFPDGLPEALARLAKRGKAPVAPEVTEPSRSEPDVLVVESDQLLLGRGQVWQSLRPGLPDAEPVLEVRNLGRYFGGVKAIDGATFTVDKGSVTALIGPNGSGKTTTIDCITGFQRPDKGVLQLCGRDIKGNSPADRAHLGIRRTFQQVRSFGGLSVLQHVMIARYAFDGTRPWDWFVRNRALVEADRETRESALKKLEMLRLGPLAQHPVDRLSYGQRKLVALACSLMSEPEILCLDEPLAGVNPTLINEISDAIARLRDLGQTFLIVEHNVDFVVSLADHVVVMAEGRVIADGGPEIVRSDPAVLESFLGVS